MSCPLKSHHRFSDVIGPGACGFRVIFIISCRYQGQISTKYLLKTEHLYQMELFNNFSLFWLDISLSLMFFNLYIPEMIGMNPVIILIWKRFSILPLFSLCCKTMIFLFLKSDQKYSFLRRSTPKDVWDREVHIYCPCSVLSRIGNISAIFDLFRDLQHSHVGEGQIGQGLPSDLKLMKSHINCRR